MKQLTRIVARATFALGLAVHHSAALAADAFSEWSKGSHSAVRLIAGGADGPMQTAGLEIKLDPGFKTYWRAPGDAGVPPDFDWSGSSNIAKIDIAWPVPHRFPDGGGSSIGYKDRVVLPLTIAAREVGNPISLKLHLRYAVCERLCIPAEAELVFDLPLETTSEARALVSEARKKVPVVLPKDAAPQPVSVSAAQFEASPASLAVKIVTMPGARVEDVFAEGSDGWLFGAAKVTSGIGGMTATLPIDDRPKNVSGPVPVTLTLVSDQGAVETSLSLDALPPTR
jgi:DsbC/DsbD-like thiol-disulfide interchange protein